MDSVRGNRECQEVEDGGELVDRFLGLSVSSDREWIGLFGGLRLGQKWGYGRDCGLW